MSATKRAGQRQRGLSIVGFIVVFAFVGFFGLVAARSAPAWIEYFAIKRAITKIVTSGDTEPASIRKTFDGFAAIDDISSVTGRDLTISRNGKGVDIGFDYEQRIHIGANVYLLFTFSSDQ